MLSPYYCTAGCLNLHQKFVSSVWGSWHRVETAAGIYTVRTVEFNAEPLAARQSCHDPSTTISPALVLILLPGLHRQTERITTVPEDNHRYPLCKPADQCVVYFAARRSPAAGPGLLSPYNVRPPVDRTKLPHTIKLIPSSRSSSRALRLTTTPSRWDMLGEKRTSGP